MRTVAELAAEMRTVIVERSFPVHVGHIGSCLSVVDLLAVLFGATMQRDEPRDRIVLSKGHAALALYAAMAKTGCLPEEELLRYCADGSSVGEHPDHLVPGVEFSTGSLGCGLSFGAGLALSASLRASPARTFVLMSDAELNEGSTWEAVMFAAHHRLSSLVAIVDMNGQQALGQCSAVLDLEDMAARWRTFGWDVAEVDGHDHDAIAGAFDRFAGSPGKPHVLLGATTFGKGVSFMETQLGWHYWSMTAAHYDAALAELAQAPGHAR